MSSFPKEFQTYENGKQRRYNLLFAVNGGAFAVAKIIDPESGLPGQLSMQSIALGMIAFTLIMSLDILAFGLKMRGYRETSGTFGPIGATVLFVLCVILSGGWTLAHGAIVEGTVIATCGSFVTTPVMTSTRPSSDREIGLRPSICRKISARA